jgi:hypothetical protein
MGRQPPSHQRRVTLAGIDVHVAISVFTLAVDHVLSVECVVLVQWLVGPKAIGIDGQ